MTKMQLSHETHGLVESMCGVDLEGVRHLPPFLDAVT